MKVNGLISTTISFLLHQQCQGNLGLSVQLQTLLRLLIVDYKLNKQLR